MAAVDEMNKLNRRHDIRKEVGPDGFDLIDTAIRGAGDGGGTIVDDTTTQANGDYAQLDLTGHYVKGNQLDMDWTTDAGPQHGTLVLEHNGSANEVAALWGSYLLGGDGFTVRTRGNEVLLKAAFGNSSLVMSNFVVT